MSRDLTSSMETAVSAAVIQPILLAEFVFDSGTVRMWTGYGSIVWGGNTFSGAGNLCGVTPIQEVADNSARGMSFTLNGIPSDLISTALAEQYQGRAAKMWLASIDSSGAITADPYQIFAGRMDTMSINDEGEKASIVLSAENRLIDLNRSRERRYTQHDQQIDYPSDLGFQYVEALQDKSIAWGAASSTSSQGNGNPEPPFRREAP